MKRVYIVAQNNSDFENEDYNRYTYIFTQLKDKFDTVFVTSSFNHFNKKQKEQVTLENVVYVKETGYQKNVSIKRIMSHFCMSYRIYKYMKTKVNEGDIIICAIPSNSLAYFMAKIKKKKKIKLIIDIHDTWPESFLPLMPNYLLKFVGTKIVANRWANLRNKGISKCDLLVGESYEYVSNYEKYLPQNAQSFPILLGVNYARIESISKKELVNNGKVNICFAGNMGVNYDLENLIETLNVYQDRLQDRINFYFLGDGEMKEIIARKTADLDFVQQVDKTSYHDYIALLKNMDIGLNSFTKNSNVKLSYKQSDYMACGLLIVNNISGKVSEELTGLGLSVDYIAEDSESLFHALEKAIKKITSKEFTRNSMEKYASENFDRQKCYQKLFDYVGTAYEE